MIEAAIYILSKANAGSRLSSTSSQSAIAVARRKIATNWAQLFSGSLVGSALTLLSFILMSRTISVESVGIVAVIQTYWRFIQGLLSFQSFQVLISFGAEALDSGTVSRPNGGMRQIARARLRTNWARPRRKDYLNEKRFPQNTEATVNRRSQGRIKRDSPMIDSSGGAVRTLTTISSERRNR